MAISVLSQGGEIPDDCLDVKRGVLSPPATAVNMGISYGNTALTALRDTRYSGSLAGLDSIMYMSPDDLALHCALPWTP